MLRFNFAINAALGTLLVTPALTLGVQHNDSLEATLKRTVASLEELGRIERRLRERDPSAIADAVNATEPALATSNGDGSARDAALSDLRGVVSKLQGELDELENRATPQQLTQVARIPTLDVAPESVQPTKADLTVGLDDALRRRLGERPRPLMVETARSVSTNTEQLSSNAKTAFESESYAADALRLGRAHYRQGEFEKALAALESGQDAESLYWKARCLEKLGRDADAIKAYNAVIALPDGGYSSQRAKEDLEFLEWRIAFQKTRAKNTGGSAAAGASKP
jgi:tetratricopeptide (TPR) repeat protein